MRKIMIVDDNYLSAEGIEKNIDWGSSERRNRTYLLQRNLCDRRYEKRTCRFDHLRY